MYGNAKTNLRTALTVFCVLCASALSPAVPGPEAGSLTQQTTSSSPVDAPAAPLAPLRRHFGRSLPFPTGEKHEYEIRFSRFPIYATVGTITFEFLGPFSTDQPPLPHPESAESFTPAPTDKLLRFRAEAISKGVLIAIIGADVKDRFESLIDERDFSARYTLKEIKEGKKQQSLVSLHNHAKQSIQMTMRDLAKPESTPRELTLDRKEGTLDLLTAFYFLRLQKLKEGQLLRFPVNDGEKSYDFEILVGKREKLSTDCGKTKVIRLEPKLFGPGRFFSRQGEMTMWVTDDDKHIPLRLTAKTTSGTLTARLINYKKSCKILDPNPEQTAPSPDDEKPKSNN